MPGKNEEGKKRSESYEYGRQAEKMVTEYLVARGYVIRETNWRAPHIPEEIDIIAEREGEMIFCEVKARSNEDFDPMDAMTEKKIRHIVRAANVYLRNLEFEYEYRFDVACISGPLDNCELDYIEDAYLPPYGK